eukprot:964306-Pelagomonas_calceolata.AAC.1
MAQDGGGGFNRPCYASSLNNFSGRAASCTNDDNCALRDFLKTFTTALESEGQAGCLFLGASTMSPVGKEAL